MITKDEVKQILLKHSRNGNDYIPWEQFDKITEEICDETNSRTLGRLSKEIVGITKKNLTDMRKKWKEEKSITNLIDYIAFLEKWDVGQEIVRVEVDEFEQWEDQREAMFNAWKEKEENG